MNMKKSLIIATVLAIMACLVSCQKSTTYSSDDLIGRWQAPSASLPNDTLQYRVFLADKDSEEPEYRFGYEWDMGDHQGWDDSKETYEEYLLKPISEDGDYHGNGWYKWKLDPDGELTIIYLLRNGGAELPKVYTVTILTNSSLSFKDGLGVVHSFTKVK